MKTEIIPNILINLLTENNKISLLGLGFFQLTRQSASYNADTKTLYPPINFLYFKNIDTQFDDTLQKKISQLLSISKDEAMQKINFWVDEICVDLAESGRSDCGSYGEFFVDENGQINFRFCDGSNVLKDSYGLKPVKLLNVE